MGYIRKKLQFSRYSTEFFFSLFYSSRRLIWAFVESDRTINKGATLCWKMSIFAYIGPNRGIFQFPGKLMISFFNTTVSYLDKFDKNNAAEIFYLSFTAFELFTIDFFLYSPFSMWVVLTKMQMRQWGNELEHWFLFQRDF